MFPGWASLADDSLSMEALKLYGQYGDDATEMRPFVQQVQSEDNINEEPNLAGQTQSSSLTTTEPSRLSDGLLKRMRSFATRSDHLKQQQNKSPTESDQLMLRPESFTYSDQPLAFADHLLAHGDQPSLKFSQSTPNTVPIFLRVDQLCTVRVIKVCNYTYSFEYKT